MTKNVSNYPTNMLYMINVEESMVNCSFENTSRRTTSRYSRTIQQSNSVPQFPKHNLNDTDENRVFSLIACFPYPRCRNYDHCKNRSTKNWSWRRISMERKRSSQTNDLSSSRQTAIVSGNSLFCCWCWGCVICLWIDKRKNSNEKSKLSDLLDRCNEGNINA